MDKAFWQEKLKHLPTRPGVYLFRDGDGNIIYVGKAESLKNRVSSYFQDSKNMAPKTLAMREKARDLEYILVDSPAEALLLECNLIKLHRPHYNILLKDDKTYPYLKLTLNEEYPRLLVTRYYKNDGSKYFGPYTNVTAMNEAVDVIRRVFPLRNCGIKPGRTKGRACLNYDLGNCSAPCVGKIRPEDYGKLVKGVEDFLNGDGDDVKRNLPAPWSSAPRNWILKQQPFTEIRSTLSMLFWPSRKSVLPIPTTTAIWWRYTAMVMMRSLLPFCAPGKTVGTGTLLRDSLWRQ